MITRLYLPLSWFNAMRIAWLNLQRNTRRSLLSVVIVAVTVFAITSVGGFGLYTYQSLEEMSARDSGNLTLSAPGYFSADEEMPLSNGLESSEQLIKRLLVHDEVRGVQPRIYFSGLISNGSKSTIYVGNGVNAREFDMKGPFLNVVDGSTLSSINSPMYDPSEPEIMLAKDLAKNLNVEPGDWVTLLATTSEGALNAYDFKVKGIYATDVPELDKRELFVHVSMAQELLVSDKVSTLSVFLFDLDQTEPMTSTIAADIEQFTSSESNDQQIAITPWQERAFFYFKVRDLYNLIFGVMGAVLAMVIFVALFNTMTMSVTERTREMGTLAAMGAYPREIVADFLKEAGLLALIGSLIGGVLSALATLFLALVEIQMPPPPGRAMGYPLTIYFDLELFAYTSLVVIAICLFTAFLSARRGATKPITEALAYV